MTGEVQPSAPPTNGAGGAPEPSLGASPPVAAPAITSEPVVASPAIESATPVAEPVKTPAEQPTLLETLKTKEIVPAEAKPADPAKPAEAKPAEVKPAAEAKPEAKAGEAAAAAETAPQPVSYEYTLPETIKLDDATKTSFHTALDTFRADPAKGAQGLIDLHNQTMQQYAEQVYRDQVSTFNKTRQKWQTDVMADEELGGAGYETSMGAVARMRDMLVPEKHLNAFNDFLRVTGAGDHPEFLRLLHNAARLYDEAPMPPPGAKPPANLGKPQGRGLRGMYKSNQGRA